MMNNNASEFSKHFKKTLTLFCGNYIYQGTLEYLSQDTKSIGLTDAYIVYETGSLTETYWTSAQPIPSPVWWVQIPSIESWGVLEKSTKPSQTI